MLVPSLRMPTVGRAASGVFAVVAAAPLCRAVGITDDPRRARRVGAATAVVDAVGVALILTANDVEAQRRAALVNASIDLAGAAALAGLGARNGPDRRLPPIAASAFLVLGAMAWLRGARQLGHKHTDAQLSV